MFYCKECQKERNWPESMLISFGPCEICNKTGECYDVPSKYLPMPQFSDEERDEINETLKRHGLDPKKVWE